jgi:hypothetical protein
MELESREIRVAICVPAGESVRAEFAFSLASMMMRADGEHVPGLVGIGIHTYRSSLLPDSRNILAAQALEANYTHVLWIDSDMTFPHDALARLLRHDVDCVGVNASRKQLPIVTTAETSPGERLLTLEESSGLEKVHRMGLGMMLVTTDALRKIRKRPLFAFEWVGGKGVHRGEDYFFCAKLRKAGITLYVDHDLSKNVGHVGGMVYVPQMEG